APRGRTISLPGRLETRQHMSIEQPALSADFDLDAWIDGTCGITAVARIVQRGDHIAERSRLEDALRVARKLRPEERRLNEAWKEKIQSRLEDVNQQLYASILVFTIQDRTSEHRTRVWEEATAAEGLHPTEDRVRYNTVALLAEIADSIIRVETADG